MSILISNTNPDSSFCSDSAEPNTPSTLLPLHSTFIPHQVNVGIMCCLILVNEKKAKLGNHSLEQN